MKRLSLIGLLLVLCFGLKSQQTAERGTFQVEVPSAKYVETVKLDKEVLEEIEELRWEAEDRNVTLENGLKVLIISRQSQQNGRRVFGWKIESAN